MDRDEFLLSVTRGGQLGGTKDLEQGYLALMFRVADRGHTGCVTWGMYNNNNNNNNKYKRAY